MRMNFWSSEKHSSGLSAYNLFTPSSRYGCVQPPSFKVKVKVFYWPKPPLILL